MHDKVTVIFDNGGGITLQVTDVNSRYQHTYSDVAQAVKSAREAHLDKPEYADWDSNEAAEAWIEPTAQEISAGAYRVFDEMTDFDVKLSPTGWKNIDGFSILWLEAADLTAE